MDRMQTTLASTILGLSADPRKARRTLPTSGMKLSGGTHQNSTPRGCEPARRRPRKSGQVGVSKMIFQLNTSSATKLPNCAVQSPRTVPPPLLP
jgi:hypothetical protein